MAVSSLQDLQSEPAGQLKISAPPSMCATFLHARLAAFLEKYQNFNQRGCIFQCGESITAGRGCGLADCPIA